jgi:hypothetical protein
VVVVKFIVPSLMCSQLPGNNLSGTLSPAIGRLTSLTLLDLNSNLLSGEMPQEVGKLTQLQVGTALALLCEGAQSEET